MPFSFETVHLIGNVVVMTNNLGPISSIWSNISPDGDNMSDWAYFSCTLDMVNQFVIHALFYLGSLAPFQFLHISPVRNKVKGTV